MDYSDLFKNNFYLSKEWAELINSINGEISVLEINGNTIPIYKGKITAGWHSYSKEEVQQLRDRNIAVSIIQDCKDGMINYSVIPKISYCTAFSKYHKKFRNLVNKSREFDLKINREPDFKELYNIYSQNMKRLNSPKLPMKFFENALSFKEASALSIEYNNKKIAGCLIFENKENVYLSFAFSLNEYFFTKPNNALYDYIIKYSLQQNKNIHLGMGIEGSGYEKFKEETGAVKLKCVRIPKQNEFLLRLGLKIIKNTPFLYKLNLHKIPHVLIPFT